MIRKKEPDMDLGHRLRQLREKSNMSIYDVERAIGVHFSTVSKYELNKRQPSLEVLKELAGLYQVSLSELIGEEPKEQELSQELISTLTRREDLRKLLVLAADGDRETIELISKLLEKIVHK